MKESKQIPKQPAWGGHVSMASLALGYVLSLALTLSAFLATAYHLLTGWGLGAFLLICATLQGWIQLFYFLNLGKEEKPKWNLLALYFMLLILLIVVIGSLFIMQSLNYRMMI